jgi:hypothetical protein
MRINRHNELVRVQLRDAIPPSKKAKITGLKRLRAIQDVEDACMDVLL